MGLYMAGVLTDERWEAFGLIKAPTVGGTACLLYTHACDSLDRSTNERTVLMVRHTA